MLAVGLRFVLFFFFRRLDLNLRLLQDLGIQLEQLEGAGRRDALAALEAVGDCAVARVADADRDLA